MSIHGLRGHETLIRLVGKRRKLTLSAISPQNSVSTEIKHEVDGTSVVASDDTNTELDVKTPISELSSVPYLDDDIRFHRVGLGEASGLASSHEFTNIHQDGGATEQKVGHINWVKCPICEKSIRGDAINTHLDVCLQGGLKDVKRKSKQLTMSQFRGSSRPSDQRLSVGFQKKTADYQQGKLRSVKIESRVTIGSPISSGDKSIDAKSMEFSSVKLEERETVVPSPLTVSTPQPEGVQRQTRMRLKRRSKVSQETSDNHPVKEEPRLDVNHNSSSACLGRTPKMSTLSEPSWLAENPALDADYCGTERRGLERMSKDSISSHSVSEGDCSCHCHLSPLNCEEESDRSRCLIGVEEKMDARVELEAERKDPSLVHSTNLTLANEKLLGVLDTKIVGRKYNRGTVCKEGMKVSIMREPDNPKDSNAIKVMEFESPSGIALGHLPREISLHLSSLLDKGLLHVWGSVTSVPASIFGAVPVRLFCESRISSKEDFLKIDGAEESLQNLMDAAENFSSLQLSSTGSASKYQQNFLYILQTVLERDSHLFKDHEKTFLEKFSSLSDDAQRLFIRLYQRKGPWFRLATVEYKDVTDVNVASEDLLGHALCAAAGYMDTHDCPDDGPEAALRKRFEVLNVLELRHFVCTTLMKKKSEAAVAKKDVLVNMAVAAAMQKRPNLIPESPGQSGSSTITQLLTKTSGQCIRVSDTAEFLLWRVKRLFFLNGDTDLSTFLVVDLGLVKYPHYKCWRERNIFDSHEALIAYEQALEVAQGMDMAVECNDTATALKLLQRARDQMRLSDSNLAPAAKTPTFLARFSASYVFKNICTLGVSILERERRYTEAVDLLRQLLSNKTIKSGRWGYWTVRLSMDLDHLGRKEESLQVAEEGVNDPWIRGGDLVALQRRVIRLGRPPRRWKTPPYAAALKRNCKEVQIQGRPLNCTAGLRSWFYGYDGQQCRVEELALQYFSSEEGGGWQGVHCEGGVWMTFFGLLMWDILFTDVPDVFQTPFQTAPLDLDTEVFFSARKCLLEAQLAAIAEGDVITLLAKTWTRHKGTMCQGVNWERHSLEELQTIALCIGGSGLSTICRLLAEDHAGWTAGMPDLLLWRTAYNTSDVGHVSEVSKDYQLCKICGCNQLERVLASNSRHETCTLEYSFQCEDRVGKSECGSGEGSNISRSFIMAPPTNRKSSKHGEAKLVEVKGPRDRLSEQQRAWIWILMNAGLNIEVCKVLEGPIE